MNDDDRASILAQADQQIGQVKRLLEERDQSLRQQGIDPEEWRSRIKAALREDPELQRRVEETKAEVRRQVAQSKAHEGFYSAAPTRRKAPRSMV